MRDVDSFVRNQVRKILFEENTSPSSAPATAPPPAPKAKSEEPASAQQGPRIVRGRVGKGNFSKATKAAGSLAEKNPAELVKKLGIQGASGGSPLEKVLSIVKQAISGASVMRSAYRKAEIMQDEGGSRFIRIAHSSEIEPRDAAQYMFLTFIAAEKEGLLAGIKGQITPGLIRAGEGEMVAVILQ